MAATTSYGGENHGIQVAQNYAPITVNRVESSSDQACLRDLRTTNPYDDKSRIQNTNGGLLKDSYRWILENKEFKQWQESENNRLLWVRGDPGKGKTMLMCGIIDELTRFHGNDAHSHISFFFCQATDDRINNAVALVRGLIYLLVRKSPALLSHVRGHYKEAGKALFEDANAWSALSAIFTDILNDPTLNNTYIIIDALDECTNGRRSLLDLIVQQSSTHLKIKWIVSSRNWPDIIERLDIATQIAPISLELNEVSVSEAVRKFIQHKVESLATVKKYKESTRVRIYDHLLLNSQGTFLWVALVCQNLDRTLPRHAIKKLEAFPPGLDDLYSRMIDQVRWSEDAELCKQILGIMSTVYRPITLSELASLIKLPESDDNNDYSEDDGYEALSEIITVCGSFLTLQEDTITFVHQSAKDFLLQEALEEIAPRGTGATHYMIFSRCLEVMLKTLRRDIFNIKLPGFSVNDVRQPSPNPLAAAEYACVYWVDHLQGSERNEYYELSLNEGGCVDVFLQKTYLYWLEALSILRSVSHGIQVMQRLAMLTQKKANSQAMILRTQDASLFIRYFRTAIESSPLQVYYSPLIFSPTRSITRRCFQTEKPDWVLNSPVVEEEWGLCLDTLEGHTGGINSIAWLPDQSRSILASASQDTTIRIWDLSTGQSVCTLKGHSDSVRLISWSPDGSQLASSSSDKTIRIWDMANDQRSEGSICIFEGHKDGASSIIWSSDGSQLAIGMSDKIVRIWNPANPQSIHTLNEHTYRVRSISWSPDGSKLASASHDKIVIIWDPATSRSISTLKGHANSVVSISWSPDGSQLASASDDETVMIWDIASGQRLFTLEGHENSVYLITWSPDGSRLASESDDNTARIWDPTTGQSIHTLEGHIPHKLFTSISWSPDGSQLASASDDETVRIWDTITGQRVSTLRGHAGMVSSIAWSPDGSRLASGSHDKTVRIWDPATSYLQSIPTLEGHNGLVSLVAWSLDASQLASASGADDHTVMIWDPATGQSKRTLQGHTNTVMSIAWSSDGGRIASASSGNIVIIWDLATGQSIYTLKVGTTLTCQFRELISWSPDGSQLASALSDTTVMIWDTATGQSLSTLCGHKSYVTSLSWSKDGSRLAVASDDTIRIWDFTTGQSIDTFQWFMDEMDDSDLSDEFLSDEMDDFDLSDDHLVSTAWSPDGSRLASSSYRNIVKIWDPATGRNVSTFRNSLNDPGSVQFNESNPNYLQTSMGSFDISSFDIGSVDSDQPLMHHDLSLSPEQHMYGYGLNHDSSWVTHNGVKILWLPAEYRPSDFSRFAISGTNLAIGCSSGHVIFLALAERSSILAR